MAEIRETAWDHVAGDQTATFTTAERKWIGRIERLYEKHPEEVQIVARNEDGSIFARLPADWLKIGPKRKSNLTDEQRDALAQRLVGARKARTQELDDDVAVLEEEGGVL